MKSSHPPLLSEYNVLIGEAFELLGRHLYGSLWTGQEQFADLVVDHSKLIAERTALENAQDAARQEVEQLTDRINRTVASVEIAAIDNQRSDAFKRRDEAAAKLARLPTRETLEHMEQTATRFRECHNRLIGALTKGDLDGWGSRGGDLEIGIPRHFWKGEPGFKLYLLLSLAALPKNYVARRRLLVWLNRAKVDDWLIGQSPIHVDDDRARDLEAEAGTWLRDLAATHRGPRPKRADILSQLREKFDISGRAAIRVWNADAPDSWTKSGRPQKQ